ncbi:hypothetical protein [Marinilactibacillus sp. Marseille-P9653]|uniref:hypothetical protein n=1 Tax=Marinilactibacillus sp. Marseille-P9653 TaxID=2866583 RepID=UPI001CE4571F|nr:hypothetical protein [Marinilactibacillus sp. Marseille-P9653]
MIGYQYLSLEVDCHQNTILGVSGYFRLELCKRGKVTQVNSEENRLVKVVSDFQLECGMGYDCKIAGESIYDPNSKRLLIGNKTKDLKFLSVGNDVMIGLSKEQIICLQIEHIQV